MTSLEIQPKMGPHFNAQQHWCCLKLKKKRYRKVALVVGRKAADEASAG